MSESSERTTSLGAALTRVMVTPAEAHVFLSALASMVGHADVANALNEEANNLAYEEQSEPKRAATSAKSSA
jgi:hypothetical protein